MWPARAVAHAYLEQADPAPGSSAAQLPARLRLVFTEPMDGSFSRVQVFDAQRHEVDLGDSGVSPDNPRVMTVSLKQGLPNGLYTVAWRTLSAFDGHDAIGAYQLISGALPAGTVAPVAASAEASFAPATAVGRWWLYVGAGGVLGVLLAWRSVFSPVLGERDEVRARRATERRARRIATIAGVVLVLGVLYSGLAQAATAADTPLWQAFGRPLLDVLGRGRFAGIWWPRLGLSVAVLALLIMFSAWRVVPAIIPGRSSLGRRHASVRKRMVTRSLIAVVLLPILAALPLGEVDAQGQSSATPQDGDLSLAREAGTTLIGLTLRPAQPGPNTLLINVLPLEGAAAAADVPISVAINGRSVPVEFCSRSCRTADVTVSGGEHVDVTADTATGGIAGFDLPALPTPDGSSLLQQMQERMHHLHTFRVDEVLRPADPPLETVYLFQAPDRMSMDLSNGSQTIFLGPTRYSRRDPTLPWQVEDSGIAIPVPSFTWDLRLPSEKYVAAQIIGTENVDGVDAQIVAFFEMAGQTPLWFRLWVDDQGLAHRADMRSTGHFMEHTYSQFDEPFAIQAPRH